MRVWDHQGGCQRLCVFEAVLGRGREPGRLMGPLGGGVSPPRPSHPALHTHARACAPAPAPAPASQCSRGKVYSRRYRKCIPKRRPVSNPWPLSADERCPPWPFPTAHGRPACCPSPGGHVATSPCQWCRPSPRLPPARPLALRLPPPLRSPATRPRRRLQRCPAGRVWDYEADECVRRMSPQKVRAACLPAPATGRAPAAAGTGGTAPRPSGPRLCADSPALLHWRSAASARAACGSTCARSASR